MLQIETGIPQSHSNLTIVPLVSGGRARLPYQLLADAMAAGTFRITEKDGGTVPTLLASNTGNADVLILDGEQLVGARQNRTTNRSIIVGAGTQAEIPVSCMEHGRWHHVSPEMQMKPDVSPSKLRRHARDVEADHVRRRVGASTHVLHEAQGAVWNEIASVSQKLNAHSPSEALDHVYTSHSDTIGAWLCSFPCEARQIGIIALIGPQILGMDLIGSTYLYERLHQRLLKGYVLDALSTPLGPEATGAAREARGYLDRVSQAVRTCSESVGKGAYAVLTGSVVGGELTDADRIVHLSAFPAMN